MTRLALSILGVDRWVCRADTHALLEATYGGMSGVAEAGVAINWPAESVESVRYPSGRLGDVTAGRGRTALGAR